MKSSKKKRTANGNTPQKTKRATKNNKEHFSIPIFIHLLQLWTYGSWLTSRAIKNQKEQQRATKSSKKLRRAAKSKKEHRNWKNQNGQKTKTSNKMHKKSKWKPGFNVISRCQTHGTFLVMRMRVQFLFLISVFTGCLCSFRKLARIQPSTSSCYPD